MNLELRDDELGLLVEYVGRELERLDTELIHTDRREFRRALAADIEKLRAIHARLSRIHAGRRCHLLLCVHAGAHQEREQPHGKVGAGQRE